ncbi:MAG: putative ABC transporter permease [Bacilli bacterium]|nr:putative ABC transporter permease [Bacilli bacterium]
MKKGFEKITDILFCFICFSIVGWIYEVALFLIEDHVYVNRGVLFGPWLPVYGAGGLLIYFLFNKLKKKPVKIGKLNIRPLLIYIYIVLLSTLVELLTTYIIDFMKSDWRKLWDYSGMFLNFQGRVALKTSLKFGIVGIIGVYLIIPLIEKFLGIKKIPTIIIKYVVIALFIIDIIVHVLFTGSTYVGP